jgi:hypothetical protein
MATTLVDGKGLPAAPVVPLATGPSVSTTAAPTPGPMTTLLGEDGPNKEDGDEDEDEDVSANPSYTSSLTLTARP